ncbi:hypothetical protein AXG93_2175s1070 [Marchantia polymorpha subsp. ruderalis]|uniref:Uncharacterized protein n=1 Tax=Marchantia polymorpha subsp. ruderalis TaxID=1480154 RepID=A0A176W6B6_MARPO|nr:hypothetical protein AXG93_2175s1070 [Marchantia polymorpha subsp. ruderalis]
MTDWTKGFDPILLAPRTANAIGMPTLRKRGERESENDESSEDIQKNLAPDEGRRWKIAFGTHNEGWAALTLLVMTTANIVGYVNSTEDAALCCKDIPRLEVLDKNALMSLFTMRSLAIHDFGGSIIPASMFLEAPSYLSTFTLKSTK